MPPFRFFCEKLSEFKSNNVKSQLFDPELIDHQSLKTKGLDFNWYRKPQKKQLQIYIQ
ncbi:uncharacterized protein METZ01_LOCUS243676 [marine metagenome]|uniref:Uncharacterized protein n=1 Tax=marine metagenome TaxID=408172 RepID=A0A382HUN3_9ZZZZ